MEISERYIPGKRGAASGYSQEFISFTFGIILQISFTYTDVGYTRLYKGERSLDKIAHPKLVKKILPRQIKEDWTQLQSLGRLIWNNIEFKQSYLVDAKKKSINKEGKQNLVELNGLARKVLIPETPFSACTLNVNAFVRYHTDAGYMSTFT